MQTEKQGDIVAANIHPMTGSKIDQITGKTTKHLAVTGPYTGILHSEVVGPFVELKKLAAQAGFNLQIISGYRSFSRQLAIWNAKVRGERAVLDDDSNELDLSLLSPAEIMHAVLRWSALPGASRHHWGTDIDVYDADAVDQSYQVQLIPEETLGDGPFSAMHQWLDETLSLTGFYRPYAEDRGGSGAERWHLSYAPVAERYAKQLSSATIMSALAEVEIELWDNITRDINSIFHRYIVVPSSQPEKN